MENFILQSKSEMNNLPKTAGVYCFKDSTEVIYIGKAINIRDRVKNHFNQPSYRDNLFMDKVEKIGFIETGSEIEALVLEANLIKKVMPKFNVIWKDDKNYFYVAVTKDKKPIVYITHQKNNPKIEYIGPFIEGNAIKKTLKFLRKVFPYYTSERHPKNKCTWCHLGLCPGPDPNVLEYKKNIKKLILILRGERKNVLSSLKKEMQALSKESKFEEAGKMRDKIQALESVMAHKNVIADELPLKNNNWQKTQEILQSVLDIKKEISRIECYDISNIQGKQAVGSMVVFNYGKPDRSQYKKFKIKMEHEPNDIAMLQEVITRRLQHPEWPYPEVMLIDGGIAQLNIAIKTKHKISKARQVKVISIAKRFRELYIEDRKKPILLRTLPQAIHNLIIHLDDEAHRFAITYHKKLRKEYLLKP